MFSHATIEHFRAFIWAYMLIGSAVLSLIAYHAPRLFPVSFRALFARADRETLREAQALMTEADQIERDSAAVNAYFARYGTPAHSTAAVSPRAAVLRAQALALLTLIVASGIDQIGGV